VSQIRGCFVVAIALHGLKSSSGKGGCFLWLAGSPKRFVLH